MIASLARVPNPCVGAVVMRLFRACLISRRFRPTTKVYGDGFKPLLGIEQALSKDHPLSTHVTVLAVSEQRFTSRVVKPREGRCPILKGVFIYGVFIAFANRVVLIQEGKAPLTKLILRVQCEVFPN